MNLSGLESLFEGLASQPGWLLLVGFLISLTESLALIGLLVPGILLLFALAALVGWDPPMMLALTGALAAGAVIGDGMSFWIGRRMGSRIWQVWPFASRPHWLAAGETFIVRHGGRSVVIGRFVGPLRPIVPLVAGSLGMRPAVFVPQMLFACALWAPLMVVPGALFGESLELAGEVGGRLTVLLVVLGGGAWFMLWLTRLVYEWGARRAPWWLKNLALWLRRHPFAGRWIGPLVQPGGREVLSITIMGMLLVVSLAMLFGALLLAPLSTGAWEAQFAVAGVAASLRNHLADPLFFYVVIAASDPVQVALVVTVGVVLAVRRRWNGLGHWLLAVGGGWLAAHLLNALMGVLLGRPERLPSIAEVPHIGLTVSTLIFGFLALMVGKALRPRQRKWLYLVTVLLLALLAFTEFYLARATLNGILAALALAGGWLALTGIGYRLRAGSGPSPGILLGVFVATWAVSIAVVAPGRYPELEESHRLSQPRLVVTADAWWCGQWRSLPSRRSRVGSVERQRFGLQLAADRDVLVDRLNERGWRPPPRWNVDSLRAFAAPSRGLEQLPHLPRDFAGRPEAIVLRKSLPDQRVILMRAWDSGVRLQPGSATVWLAQARELEPGRALAGFARWRETGDPDAGLRALVTDLSDWPLSGAPGEPLRLAQPMLDFSGKGGRAAQAGSSDSRSCELISSSDSR